MGALQQQLMSYGTTQTYILDQVTGSTAAFSMRKLASTATFGFRVRRASDSSVSDIGFTAGGDCDTASLLTFCAGTNGFITRFYDQS